MLFRRGFSRYRVFLFGSNSIIIRRKGALRKIRLRMPRRLSHRLRYDGSAVCNPPDGHKKNGRSFCLRPFSLSKKILTSWWTGEQAPPPLPPLPVFAEIFQISGRKNCKETIFALENEIFRRKNPRVPTVHAAGHDGNSRGLWPSRALRGFFDSLTAARNSRQL